MVYWAHAVGSFLLRFVSLRVAYALATLFGPLIGYCWPGHYRRARRNMVRVLGPTASSRVVSRRVRGVYRNYGKYLIDLLWMPRACFEDLDRDVTIVGQQHLDEGLRHGKGLVLVTAHVGNWDLGTAILAHRGYPISVIVETLEPPRWNERVQAIREQIGMRTIPLESGARQMFDALRSNRILGVVIDRPLAEGGVPINFFGSTARVPDGAARLALRTGAAVAVAAAVRRGRSFVAYVSPLISVEPSGDRAGDAEKLTQQVMDWLEALILQHPDQWFMFRDMWPHRASASRLRRCATA